MSRCGYDIVSLLVDRGLSKNDAIYIDNEISKDQIPFLINCLVSESSESEEILRNILYEYNIELDDDLKNISILDSKNPLYINYNMNSSVENAEGIEDYVLSRNIPYIIKGSTIYMHINDDATLYMLDDMMDKIKDGKMSNLNESGTILGFSNEFERRRLLKDAGISEDFGDDVSQDADQSTDSDPAIDQEEYPQVDVVTDPVTDVVPVQNSDAMNTIQNCLTTIQDCVSDLKVSEFKNFIIQLNDLINDARSKGISMISERKRK